MSLVVCGIHLSVNAEIVVLTNLPPAAASARIVMQLYRERWQVERLFLTVTQNFEGEINTLAYPKAALFSFSLALLAYNLLATLRAALASRTFQEQRFAADFFEFGRSGQVYTRDRIIQLDSQPIHAVIPLPNLAIRLLDLNTAQVNYNSQVEHDSLVKYSRRSSIWSRTESGWVMRFHQGTPDRS